MIKENVNMNFLKITMSMLIHKVIKMVDDNS